MGGSSSGSFSSGGSYGIDVPAGTKNGGFSPNTTCARARTVTLPCRALAGPDIGRKLRKFAEMRRNTAEGPQGPSPFVRDMYVAVFGLPRFLHSSKGRRTAPDEAWAALRRERTSRTPVGDGPRPGGKYRWYSGGPVV